MIIKFLFALVFFVLISLKIIGINTELLLVILNLSAIGVLVYYYKHSKPIVVFLLFISTYYYNLVYYYFYNLKTSYYSMFFSDEYYDITLIIMSSFLLSLLIFHKSLSIENKKEYLTEGINRDNNIILYLLCLCIMIFIIIFGKSGQNVFESGTYKIGVSSTFGGLAISEYVLLFIALAYKFSYKIKFSKLVIVTLSLIYMLKMFLYGGRIESIQVGLLLYILYYENKFNYLQVTIFTIIGYLLNEIYGAVRANVFYYLANPEKIPLFETTDLTPGTYYPSNAGEVLYNSALFVGVIKDEIVNISDRMRALFAFILDIFIPGALNPFKEANLSEYLAAFSPAGGGGFIGTYFYYYLGIIGVVLIGWFVSLILKKAYVSDNEYIRYYSIIVIATFPRWSVYDPITMFKLSGYIIILLFIFNIIHRMLSYTLIRK